MRRSLVVSIHDVSPLTRDLTELILNRLYLLGVRRTSLLVIPDHHQHGHFLDDAPFCEWLQSRVKAGHEPVVHGYYHWRPRKPLESFLQRFTTRIYTADEGEFFDKSEEDAFELVGRALEEFQSLGLQPTGFIAPAWLLSKEAERALRRLGLRYTTRLGALIDLAENHSYPSQSLVYSTRSSWRRMASRFWNANLHLRLQDDPLMRLSIHPPDFTHKEVRRQIERFLREALKTRTTTTYAGFLESQSGAKL